MFHVLSHFQHFNNTLLGSGAGIQSGYAVGEQHLLPRSLPLSLGSRSLPAAAAKSLQSCLTLCDPTDGSPLGSSVPGIVQARILEWVAISFSKHHL